MKQPEVAPAPPVPVITLTGELVLWITNEADKAYRTPTQQTEFLLLGIKNRAELRRQASEERRAKREASEWQLSGKAA